MVFSRLWGFVQRHKKKFIFTTVLVGGAYFSWQVLLPKLQEHLLQKLLKELSKGADETPESAAARRRERFEHKQKVSDAHARRKLAALRARQNTHFEEERLTERVKEAKSKEDKLEAFKALQVECLAKAASAMYLLHLVYLLHRVGFNVVGRELEAPSVDSSASGARKSPAGKEEDEAEVHAAFLQTLDYLEENVTARIAEVVRESVKECVDRAGLGPTSPTSRAKLEKLLAEACRTADTKLLAEGRGAATLLPDEINSKLPGAHRQEVIRLLDEARDWLDSPQFVQVFQVVAGLGAAQLADGLEQEMLAAGAGDGPSWPMAKFFGPLTKLAGQTFDEAGAVALNEAAGVGLAETPAAEAASQSFGAPTLAERFAAEPRLVEFCEGVFFQEGRSSGGSS